MSNCREEELVWVEKAFAEKYNEVHTDKSKNDERIKLFDSYINTVKESSKNEFKANLENLDEDIAIYNGLMMKVKQSFEKAKNEQLTASYNLWEKFEKEIPSVSKKIEKIITVLNPLEEKLNTINELLGNIRTFDIDRMTKSVENLANQYGKSKEMVEFLVKNFKHDSKE